MTYPKTERAQELIQLVLKSKAYLSRNVVSPTDVAKEIGTSAAWVTRALREIGVDVEQYWLIGRRKKYTVRETFK